MHRNELLQLLSQYRTTNVAESGNLNHTRLFITQHEDCFNTHLLPGHVTGSAWVVNQNYDRVLMLHHKKLNKWFQPGGHADSDHDIRRVALREVSEETGLDPSDINLVSEAIFDIDIHSVPDYKGMPSHKHYDIRFLIQVDDSIVIPGNDESYDILWVELHDTQHFNHNLSTYRMMEKTRRLRSF